MERICEPELMDDPQQARCYAEADFSASDADLIERLLSLLPDSQASLRVLDLGCGPGNISFRLARALPAAEVVGLDGAEAMLAIAEERLAREPRLQPRLRFVAASLPLSPEAATGLGGPFDLLVCNSLLHHLHDPQALPESLPRLAAPGAWLLLRDLRRPADSAGVAELVRLHAADAPARLRHDYEHSLRAAFRLEEVSQQLRQAGLASLELAESGDRYLEVWGAL